MPKIDSTLLARLRPIQSHKVPPLAGRQFGRLTVIEPLGSAKGTIYWRCVCKCGRETASRTCHLTGGRTISCGCYQRTHAITHGMSHSDEYQIWASMKDRCFGPSSGGYVYYGARGIKVCDEWCGKDGFQRFYDYIGPRPSKQYSLEREDVNGNYEPGNVHWGTLQEQGANRRNSRFIQIGMVSKTARGWSEVSGNIAGTITERIRNGWPAWEAVFLPPMSRIRNHRDMITQSHTSPSS